jgi:hypothetical protein
MRRRFYGEEIMGTKIEGDGCYDAALPDEPMFTLLARDPFAPELVRRWANNRREAIAAGTRPTEDEKQVNEAVAVADRMRDWRKENLNKWREAKSNGGVQNAERRATLNYIGARIEALRARDVDSRVVEQLAVLAGDLVAGFHLDGQARHPADLIGQTSDDLPPQEQDDGQAVDASAAE